MNNRHCDITIPSLVVKQQLKISTKIYEWNRPCHNPSQINNNGHFFSAFCTFHKHCTVIEHFIHHAALAKRQRREFAVFESSCHLPPVYHTRWRLRNVPLSLLLNI